MGVGSSYWLAVMVAMTKLAKSLPVINFIPEFRVIFPFLNMVCLKVFCAPAFLTGIVIALDNHFPPRSVSPRIAIFIAVFFSLRFIAAILRTIFHTKMPIRRIERIIAMMAYKLSAYPFLSRKFTTAGFRTRFHLGMLTVKLLTAYWAIRPVALLAVRSTRVIGFKLRITYDALVSGKIFSYFHNVYYTISALQRWSDMTGQQPVLLDS